MSLSVGQVLSQISILENFPDMELYALQNVFTTLSNKVIIIQLFKRYFYALEGGLRSALYVLYIIYLLYILYILYKIYIIYALYILYMLYILYILYILYTICTIHSIPAWASGPSEIFRYFFMRVVTGSGPRFRKP